MFPDYERRHASLHCLFGDLREQSNSKTSKGWLAKNQSAFFIMATLAINNTEIYAQIGLILGTNRLYAQWPSDMQSDAQRIIRAGRRKFFLAYAWSFLEANYPIVTAPSTTLTGVCVNGVITTSGGTLPASMAGNFKIYPQTDGGLYDVSAQSGTIAGSTITLVDTSAARDFNSQTIKLYQYRYALPSNFSAFIDPIVVENWQDGTQLSEYGTLPEFQIRGTLNQINTVVGPPEIFAITHDLATTAAAETGVFAPYLLVYPLMDNAYTLKTRIRIEPGDSLTDVSGFVSATDPVSHPIFSECLMEAILAQAEIMYGKPTTHSAIFSEVLQLAIQRDRQMKGTRGMLSRDTMRSERQLDRLAARRASIDLTNAIL